MATADTLIASLSSPESSVRDAAALALMNTGDARAVDALFRAIGVPANENYRGTLVYALSAFDCSDHLLKLVDLALNGNFEVSCGAFNIIEDTISTQAQFILVSNQLAKIDRNLLVQQHSVSVFEALTELVSGQLDRPST